jgi:Transglycosylase SLT domain
MTRQEIQALITTEAQRLGLDPALALALAEQESGFNPEAKSPTGVVGLFQVTNKTGAAYGQTPATRTDPAVSARAGLTYFKDLLTAADGHVETALRRYNGGTDAQFAQHVLRHKPAHALALELYGVPSAPSLPTARSGEAGPGGAASPSRGAAPSLADVLYGAPGPAAPSLTDVLYGAPAPRAAATTA